MKPWCALLLCLVVLTRSATARDPQDGGLVDCGSEKVAVFEGTASPDGRFAFGWTVRRARNQMPVNWATYNPENLWDWLDAYPFDPDAKDAEYRLVNGVLDLREHGFSASGYPRSTTR